MRSPLVVLVLLCILSSAYRARSQAPESLQHTLGNVLQLSDRILSGSSPTTSDDFAELARRGIETVVSVDGAPPNVELAKSRGLRYIHIPIGYDGLTREAQLALVRVVRESDAPIYIHCHHGKHRGPAAAAIACMATGDVDHRGATDILERAGTSQRFPGLWYDVATFEPLAPDESLPELLEISPVSSFVQSMTQIDDAYNNLLVLKSNGWQKLAERPNLTATSQWTLLSKGFEEAARFAPIDFDDQSHAREIHALLQRSRFIAREAARAKERYGKRYLTQQLVHVRYACISCHEKYRNGN